MKILITGASGFVGSFLVEHGLEHGHEVWAALRATSSRRYLTDPRIRFIELNLGDDAELQRQLSAHGAEHGAFDCVIHAAGATKAANLDAFRRTNTAGTLRLARTLLELNLLRGRFVFVSSLSVMGPAADPDSAAAAAAPYRPISDSDRPVPNTDYGRSKLEAEEALAGVEGLDYVILRPTGVYGPRERDYFLMADSIRKHIDFAVGYRPQRLTFIYVRDLVDACYAALTCGERGRAYFLSDGGSYDSREFGRLLQAEMGVRGVLRITAPEWFLHGVCALGSAYYRLFGRKGAMPPTLNLDKFRLLRQRNWLCDIEPARRDLGFAPQWTLAAGVKEAVAWYKSEGWL